MAFDVNEFIKQIKEMKVVELNELVKAIEEEFGVTAAAPMAAAVAEDQGPTELNVELIGPGANKIPVIKLVREILGLGLMDAKKFAENGGLLKEGASPEEAEALVAKFKDIGADIVAK